MACTGVLHNFIFTVQVAPIGSILAPLKSVSVLFWPFWANKVHYKKYRETGITFQTLMGGFFKVHIQIPRNNSSNWPKTDFLLIF